MPMSRNEWNDSDFLFTEAPMFESSNFISKQIYFENNDI